MKILVVEDNESLLKGITYRLQDDGHSVEAISDGGLADDFLKRESLDLAVLDINLPNVSGLELVRNMRLRGGEIPVIMLTARSATEDRVQGLDAGADDYLVKPFEMDELSARVRALGRRRSHIASAHLYVGDLRFDGTSQRLESPDGVLELPKRELDLFLALLEAKGAPLSKDRILDRLYGVGSATDDSVIEVYVSRLRKRIAPYRVKIQMSRGIGYSLREEGA
ncbi:MAG: response regulator transcription factor [Pseudomonadota bacterium]